MIPGDAALVIIDVQDGFRDPRWGTRNNPRAEERIAEVLTAEEVVGHLAGGGDDRGREGR
jgi:nicotinamidase-related amidase